MKKTEPSSSRPAPNPDSSPRSVASTSLETPSSRNVSFHQQTLRGLELRMQGLRDEDFANWGVMPLEDLGIVDIERVIGSAGSFGRKIRNELTYDGATLKEKWYEVASRLWVHSPASINITNMFAALCFLAASQIYVDGISNAPETK